MIKPVSKMIFAGMMVVAFINAGCYKGHGLSPTAGENADASGIRGAIHFTGDWPDSTKQVNVAVLKTYPEGIRSADSLMAFVIQNLVTFSDTIPRDVESCEYELLLEPDTYAWILAVWFPDIPLYLFGVKELGAYYGAESSGLLPKPVHVMPGVILEGIDIEADFANINREIPFFKAENHP